MEERHQGFTVRDRRRVTPDGELVDSPSGTQEPKPGGEHAGVGGPAGESSRRLPPVDFSGFVIGLAQMALVHLGELPEPQTGKVARDLEQARHTIDILDMLQQKTRGNLTDEEARLLQGLCTELKMKFVWASRKD